jgi:hypothetical protein
MGGESRKSKRPLAVAESKALANFRRDSPWSGSGSTSENTNLKGLTSFIVRNVSKNVTSEGRRVALWTPMRITSSENTGDVIVENTSMTVV